MRTGRPRSRSTAVTAPPYKHHQVFPARPDQVREARRFLRAVLEGCPLADDAVLCVSEMSANSVLYSDSGKEADGTFTVRADVREGDYAWIEVEDSGGPWDKHAHRDGRPHGLDIVVALTADWGIDGDDRSRTVWARLDWPAT
jgi:hypothetical protein